MAEADLKPELSLPFHASEPMRVLVNRNHAIESVHEVDVALCDGDGQVILGLGDHEGVIFPRSAMKPLQALSLVELWLDDQQKDATMPPLVAQDLSLICASHNGEPLHSEAVQSLLGKYHLSPDDLICGAHWSLDQDTLIAQVRGFDQPEKIHNNCSGKHAGMMILAHCLTGSATGYAASSHQAQQRILGVLDAMTGLDLMAFPQAVDGCGAPVYSGPLGNWARAFALFAGGGYLPPLREQACVALRKAIAEKPFHMAGQNRACSAINAAFGERITVKVGAEGVYSAAFHDLGLGMMLKARDGSKRGAEVALGGVISALGYPIDPSLQPYFYPAVKNWAGDIVGQITLDKWH